jgi:hypothetical protein
MRVRDDVIDRARFKPRASTGEPRSRSGNGQSGFLLNVCAERSQLINPQVYEPNSAIPKARQQPARSRSPNTGGASGPNKG